jgi:hypothetical protein
MIARVQSCLQIGNPLSELKYFLSMFIPLEGLPRLHLLNFEPETLILNFEGPFQLGITFRKAQGLPPIECNLRSGPLMLVTILGIDLHQPSNLLFERRQFRLEGAHSSAGPPQPGGAAVVVQGLVFGGQFVRHPLSTAAHSASCCACVGEAQPLRPHSTALGLGLRWCAGVASHLRRCV